MIKTAGAKFNILLFQRIAACGLGLVLGIVFVKYSPLIALGIIAAVFSLYVISKKPEIALLGILIATSSIVFEEKMPLIFVGGISFHIPDILLLGSLGLIAIRRLVVPEFKIVRTPLDWPLLIFLGVTLLSTLVAISHSAVDIVDARRGIRVLSYYLTFFIVTNLVRERRQLKFLLNGLFILSTVVAGAMVMQFLLGDSVRLFPGRVESLMTQGAIFSDITRILPPGWSIVLVSFITISCILVLEKLKPYRWLKVPQWGLLGMAFLITFLRSYWAALIVVFILLLAILRGDDRKRLVKLGLVIMLAAAMILLVLISDPGSRATRLAGASIHRLSTLFRGKTFQGQDSSLNWRKFENKYALTAIVSHPVIGLGIGVRYRPRNRRMDPAKPSASDLDFRKHLHNGHLGILLQSGLLGYLSLMWLSLAFLFRGLKYWRYIANDRLKGIVLGFTLAYLVVLLAAVANSAFMQWRWTPVIGIIMGINEVILKKIGREESVA
jgi:O-antigen ligase